MMSMADMAAILRLAAERDCRVLITGDHEQLAAVEGGGGMMMLARQLGYVQLAEPVRFASDGNATPRCGCAPGTSRSWPSTSSRAGCAAATAEEAMELACRAWVADHLAGKDSLLLARTEEQARELSRRVRDDLHPLRPGPGRRRGQAAARRGRQPRAT